jgi:hypothetical protein
VIEDDMLEGLNPTDSERLEFYRALDELEAEEAGVPYDAYADPDPDEDYGPWDDSADDQAAQLRAIGEQLDQTYSLDSQRAAEDITDQLEKRPSAEAKIARGLRRIEAGTYLPPAQLRAARDAGGRWASACGEPDEFGRCSSRFHAADCHVIAQEAAATGSADEARSWAATLRGYTPTTGPGTAEALGLASPGPHPGEPGDTWASLLRPEPEPGAWGDTYARALAELRMEAAPRQPREPLPDVSELSRQMGLR